MFWKRAPLRKVLLTSLIVLSACGFFTTTQQASQCWQTYEHSKNISAGAYAASQIMMLAKHLAFERGRTAVVLRKPEPISEENLKFIDARRAQSDLSITKLKGRLPTMPDSGASAFLASWTKILALRKEVDRDKHLPLTKRDPALVQNWVKHTTQFLEQSLALTQKIAHHFRNAGKPSQLIELSFLALKSRLITGLEASIIAQQVAANKPMPPPKMITLYQMYGQHKEIDSQIQHYVNLHATPKINTKFANIREAHAAFRRMQEKALGAWLSQRPSSISLNNLTAASIPVLDGMSELMILATEEAREGANKQVALAKRALAVQIFFAIAILLIMALSIYYVIEKVVKPIEEVDTHLRHIGISKERHADTHTNEIERLKETAQILDETFQEKNRLEKELNKLAFYDALTALPNRRLMMDRLRQKILRAKRNQEYLALLFIDLDEFKPVNDQFGHEAGDWLLKEVAKRIAFCVRASDTAARMGGDEFIVLLPDLKRSDDVLAVAEKIRHNLELPFIREKGQEIRISSSIGAAIFPENGTNEDELLVASNKAMYLAKNTGRNQVALAST